MADKIEYSRLLMKRSTQSGEVPTVPPITAVTLNQFTPTDVFVGEFFLNAVDDLLWIRTDNGILPIDLSGSTGTTVPTLNQVLFQGNITSGIDIEVSSGDTIVFGGLSSGTPVNVLAVDASGNTIVTSVTGSTIIVGGDYLPLSGGTVTGNTYFGATSGITMDQVNSRIGVRTSAPEYYVDLFGTKSRIYYADTSGGVLQMTGDTFLPRYSIAAAATITKPLFSLSMGVRTWDDVTFPGYGKIGDTFIYGSNEANGMNIINRQGTGTEDYIRFYTGQDANGTTPDIHIQGSGSTRGFVGLGTITPTEKLDVVGNVKVTGQSYVALPATGTTTSATTINWNDGNVQEEVLGANTTFTFTNPKAGATYILIIKQSSGGGNTITWDPRVTWAGGTAPTMSTFPDRFDVYTFIFDGNKFFGSYIQNFP